jgi:hypothetical protein
MYHAAAGMKSVIAGPCIDNYGIGESAQGMSLSRDGRVLLLSAGLKLSVYRRLSLAGDFEPVFNMTFGVVVNFAALSSDGGFFICSCDDGLCGFKIASSGSYDRAWSVASIDGFHFEQASLSSGTDNDALVVALMNNADSTQW